MPVSGPPRCSSWTQERRQNTVASAEVLSLEETPMHGRITECVGGNQTWQCNMISIICGIFSNCTVSLLEGRFVGTVDLWLGVPNYSLRQVSALLGAQVRLFPGAEAVLQKLASDTAYAGVQLAVASSTTETRGRFDRCR